MKFKIILTTISTVILLILLVPFQNSQVPDPTTIELNITKINGEPAKNITVELIHNDTTLYAGETNEYGGILFILTNPEHENFIIRIKSRCFYKEIKVNISDDNHYDMRINEYSYDLNNDGVVIQDYNDLMGVYRCFLGINKNCGKIDYQNWIVVKREYECFIGN